MEPQGFQRFLSQSFFQGDPVLSYVLAVHFFQDPIEVLFSSVAFADMEQHLGLA